MKPVVLFLTVLGCVVANPNGYYHQEYNYKTSSSSYKNNELQHQTDDQGYYRKDGDLSGKVRPRVNANSEHSEYVNPNLRNSDYNTGLVGNANGDLSSYGHMRANVGSYGSHDLSSEGLARADRLVGTKSGGAYSGYSSGSYGTNSYGTQSYGTSSNLRSITSSIQQDLERELQRAIQEQRAYSQSGVGVSELERELRMNLTNKLNSELANRYGQQSIRGGLSYTISGGRLHSTANYDNQELQDLRTQIENNLLNQLRTQYYQTSSHYENRQSSQNNYGYSTTVRPVYYYQQPYRPATTVRPYAVYVPSSQIRYTPVSNPESLTTIASRVQNQLDSRLNELLDDVQRRYFSSSSSYSLTNYDVVLENLRNELKNNITYLLNENVKSNYGNQIPKDGHMYSISSDGQTSSQQNYAISDLENLRSQIERNLIEKLNRDFETYRSRWYQQSSHSQASQSSSNIRYGSYSTPRYDTYSTPHYNSYDSDVEHFSTRPSSTHIVPLISSGGSSSSNGRHYNLLAGTSQSGYEISSGSGGSLSELQSRLQQDLSRQLQSAISRGQYGSYSSSGSYTAPTYQSSLQELSNELNRNLTKQLQEYSASGSYSSYGNFDQTQLANLRNQLQANLMRQLQQGLQQSFQSSSSFSSSSSSSSNANYRPARGFDNYQSGQYRSGGNVLTMNGADCVGDDPNAYNSHRMKRSYPPYRTRPLGLGYSSNAGYNSNYGYRGGYSQQQELGQQVDESDLTQQVEDVSLEKLQQGSLSQQVDLNQQVDDSQLTQQVEDSGFGKLQLDSQNQQQINAGQQIDDDDLIQVEDKNYGKVQLDSHSQIGYGQQTDDSELTQQVQTENLGQLRPGSQNQRYAGYGQQIDDSELTQQLQTENLGQLQPGSQNQRYVGYGQQDDDSELTQQVENEDFGQLQLASQNQQGGYSPQIENLDLTQQVEDENFGKLQAGAQNQQQVDQSSQLQDLTQQIEDSTIGKLQVGSQAQQQVHLDQEPHSAHQVQGIGLGKLQLGSQGQQQGQQEDNSDLTQQVEDFHGQQLVQQREDIGNSDLTQQVEEVNFGGEPGQVDNSDLIEQVGGTGLGKLQQNSQNQQPIRYGTQNSNLNRGDINISQNQHGLSQQEDNSDLTQQVQNHFTDDIQPGSVQNSQQGEDFGQFTSHAHINLGHHQTNDNNRLQFNFNPKQRQAALELRNELSKQLKDAVRSHYTGSYSHLNSHQSTYQDLVKELERNLTRQLQAVGPSSGNTRYTYSFVFSGPQRDLLKQQLENELKLQLQREISFASGSTNLGQHQIDQELSNNDLNQNIDSQSQTQQNINSELTQQQQNGLEDVEFGGQTQDLTQQIGYDQINQQGGFEQGQLVDNNNRGHQTNDNRLGFNFNQKQAALELGNELSRQLKDAVRSHYTGSSSHLSSYQTTYQDLVKELERNLTQQLQAVGPSSGNTRYTYSFVFSGPQRDLLKQQLETKLKLQLQREISFASGSTNLGQHQINQELSNNDLNQNIDSQSQTQQNINSELTQQQQNGLENIESGGQTQDLTQQIGYDQINQQSEFGQGQLVDNHNSGRLQFGTQHIEQQSVNNQNDLTQQIDINHPGNSQLTGHQIGTQSTDQLHNPLLSTQFASSGRLQFGRRPVNQKPTDSTNFINTEVNQQQQLYPNQNIDSQQNNNKPNNLQTLNQVITQQGDNGEAITDSELIDNQQQQENTDLSFQNENYASHIPTGLAHNSVGQSTLGQGFATNKPSSYAQILRQGNSGYTSSGSPTFQTGQQTNPLNQHHDDSFHTYLNNQQVELAYQLKNELSRQLQDAIAQNNYALSQSNLRGEIRGQFLSELQRNITKQLEQIFNGDGYSTYSSYSHSILTPEQKDKLLRQLSADLSGQLQQNIQVTYDQQNNGHNSFHTGITHSSSAGANSALGSGSGGLYSGHGSNVNKYDTQDTANQLNYGQQEVVDSETVSALHPLQPEQATAVQNVVPQSNYHNTGIKRPGRVFTPTLPPSPIVEPEVQSQSELITPSNINTGSLQQEVAGLNETQDENLPWWKRVGNKIKQGATNLKEKIIG